MRILLSNDDGIHSPCLRALHDALCEAGHELDVVAPLTEQSGVGCSVTLHNPLRLYPVQEPGFSGTAVAGTPVDCVKLALTTLLPQPPDVVVVGINNAEIKGIRAARMAESRWAENYERREDPAGRPYWWIADFLKRDSGGDDTDIALMEGNWVAVTPLQVDRTDRELLGRLQERFGV